MRFILYVISVLTFVSLVTVPLVSGLSLNGGILVAQVLPGDHIKQEIAVSTSKNERPLNVTVNIMDMLQGQHGETVPINRSTPNPYSAKGFLKASPSSFHIDPGGSQEFLLEGVVPTDAAPGGKYAVINIEGIPSSMGVSKNEGGVTFGIAINGLVELTVSKDKTTKTGTIARLSVQEPVSRKQQNLSIVYNNTGDVHYNFKTTGVLKDENKRVLANANVTSGIPIMPGATRLINFSLVPKNELMPGSYDINATVRLEDGTVLASKEAQIEVKA